MRKTILLLINGFGVERSDSEPIYSANLMPNLDRMSNNYLFSSLIAPQADYDAGVKNFSKKEIKKSRFDSVDNIIYDQELGKVENLNLLKQNITGSNKLYVFFVYNGENKFNQLKEIVKSLNQEKNKTVIINFILSGTNTEIYGSFTKFLSKISYELFGYGKVGIITGKNKLNSDNFIRAFYKSQGEHWSEPNKKIEILNREVVIPNDADVFIVNPEFSIAEEDKMLFFNYENIDTQKFMEKHSNLRLAYYSLYPEKNMINLFTREEGKYLKIKETIEKHKINLTVFTSKDRLNNLNYYLNGEENCISPYIRFVLNDLNLFNNQNALKTINDSNDAIIIDFDISSIKTVGELKASLTKIDEIIGTLENICVNNKYSFIRSSLYGIHSTLREGPVEKIINFSGKVPIVFYNREFPKKSYSLRSGDVFALSQTFLTNVCDDVKQNMLVHKKRGIEKLISK